VANPRNEGGRIYFSTFAREKAAGNIWDIAGKRLFLNGRSLKLFFKSEHYHMPSCGL
jgi:hypothetical protein